MNDFEHHLTALLDDVASSVHPHSDVDALFVPTITPVPNEVHGFRPRWISVAAASLVLFGGSAFAMERVTNDPPTRLVPAASPVTEPMHEPTTTEPAMTTTTSIEHAVDATVPTVRETSDAKPVVPDRLVPVPEPTVPPTAPTVPPTEPTPPPVVIEFTARLGTDGRAQTPMTQGFSGRAQPGSAIRVASEYGISETVANAQGTWTTTLTMLDVPDGAVVAVRITSNTSERVREFTLIRPGPTPPPVATIEFVAYLGANGEASSPMTQGFFGKAQPGSAIRVGTDWGVAETTAGASGAWETTLVMPDVPPGTTVAVRITSSTSDRVREFTLHRPGSPTPAAVDFTANAAWSSTDAPTPFDEYWGTSTAGAVISITSDYGSTQVESNAESKWSARLEFPSAPVGVTFNVHITSSKGVAAYDFALTRTA
jgi:hypothetical protein